MDRYDLYNFTKSHTHSLTSRPSSMRVGDSRRPQRLLIIFGRERYLIQFSIHCARKFLNWLRTSCMVSITTAATWHNWTADFWADFEQRVIVRAINEGQSDCGAVSMPTYGIRTLVVSVDTAKHFIILIETLFLKMCLFLFIRQHKLWNDAQSLLYGNSLQLVLCCKHNCFLTLWFH